MNHDWPEGDANPEMLGRDLLRGASPKTLARRMEGRSALQRVDELGKRAEYLAFTLGPEAYAIEIGSIVEILKPLPITEVPRATPDVIGVMSVRGRLVTVLDLKARFRLPRSFTMDRKSRILLVDAVDEEIGLLVDEVLQVYRLSEAEIEPPTVLGSEQAPHVVGIARPQVTAGDAVLLLLDLAPLFAE
ncbi:MAG TPA: chemotaxis protein CheW [Labilithrix sp.]|nr:chemotaxis protein CheW [Labilithrix sp.]